MLLRKLAVKWYFIFPPHLISASALPRKTESQKIASFHLNAKGCFANIHTQKIHIITWSQLNRPSFVQESAVCTKQNLGWEYSMLLPVTTHSSFTKSGVTSVAMSKVGVVPCRA